MVFPSAYRGTSDTLTPPTAGGGSCIGARVSCGPNILTQLVGQGYTWPTTDWDDAAFVQTYGSVGTQSLADAAATCFVIPTNGRYRLRFQGDVFPVGGLGIAVLRPIIYWEVDSFNGYWGGFPAQDVGVPTRWVSGLSRNTISGGVDHSIIVPGFAGDIWILETDVKNNNDHVYQGAWATIEQLCTTP